MLLIHGSFWWFLASGMVGLMLGYSRRIPRWGFLLGLFLGPIGWGLILLFPASPLQKNDTRPKSKARPRNPRDSAGFQEPGKGNSDGRAGLNCSRCRHAVEAGAKVCSQCGNILLPVQYKVHPKPEKE